MDERNFWFEGVPDPRNPDTYWIEGIPPKRDEPDNYCRLHQKQYEECKDGHPII